MENQTFWRLNVKVNKKRIAQLDNCPKGIDWNEMRRNRKER